MRILLVTDRFPPEGPTGVGAHVRELALGLSDKGHAVAIFCCARAQQGSDGMERIGGAGVTIYRLGRSSGFIDAWDHGPVDEVLSALADVISEQAIDLVHVHHWLSVDIMAACHELGVATVCTLHDMTVTCARASRVRTDGFCDREQVPDNCASCVPLGAVALSEPDVRLALARYRQSFERELSLANGVILPTASHRRALEPHVGELLRKAVVVPLGQAPTIRGRLRAPRGRPRALRIGHWGNLGRDLGTDLLLTAMDSMIHRQSARLELFGRAPSVEEQDLLRRLAEPLFLRWQEDYRSSDLASSPIDIAVIPSRASESWGVTLDEAFLLGLPVIVSDRGALAERVGGAGATFRAEQADDLARLLDELVDSPDRVREWRNNVPAPEPLSDHLAEIERVYVAALTSIRSLGPR